ncbi:hypothetical protein CLV28_2999 [Sediminihabitans luteus]|uniref:Uncharacterized protein n=1 Tax=Sediminihabitans luteus TaxID=1138585 RepID=A0A2M9CC20_9CELL|nr:hypothetical protein [Sediminihabitans luteus]PJJ68583.1 hypothetical protein CLV28_2999 [Sediminihabitans luteus]GII99921.1 hypothetical protein Slu03_22990 [Sediminihabitans luteus]
MPRWLSRLFDPESSRPAAAVADTVQEPDSPAAMSRHLRVLVGEINRSAGSLPPEGVVLARQITDLTGEVLRQSEVHAMNIHARVSLNAVIRDYLPTTLRTFVAATRADTSDAPARQLTEQLVALRDSVRETVAALRDDDVRALEAQGMFLSTKFGGLDL